VFYRELPAHRLRIHCKNGFSAGKYQLRDQKSTRGRGFHRELLAYLLGFRPVRSKLAKNPSNGNNSRISRFKSYILTIQTFLKFKNEDLFEMKNKPDPVQLGTSYLSK
jgi:hypothetical protein